MFSIFRGLIDRLKALFATSAALELEAEFLARDAERRAELLRQAERYDTEGLRGIAQHLRTQAEAVSSQQPLAGVLPIVAHLQNGLVANPASESDSSARLPGVPPTLLLQIPKKKSSKS